MPYSLATFLGLLKKRVDYPSIMVDVVATLLLGCISHFGVTTRGAQCIDKEILISKKSKIDIDIEIDKRTFE